MELETNPINEQRICSQKSVNFGHINFYNKRFGSLAVARSLIRSMKEHSFRQFLVICLTSFGGEKGTSQQGINLWISANRLLKVYMIDFFICSIKPPQCTDKYSKNFFFDSDFSSSCFDVPKASNFTSGGVQNRETKNRRLGTIVTSFQDSQASRKTDFSDISYFLINNAILHHFSANLLAHNKKMTDKSVFREAWSTEMTSQSSPVSCFWSRGFIPHRK